MGLVMGIDCRPKARLYAFMYDLKKHRLSRSRAQIFENGKSTSHAQRKIMFRTNVMDKIFVLFFSNRRERTCTQVSSNKSLIFF